jgi:hypothetical protein
MVDAYLRALNQRGYTNISPMMGASGDAMLAARLPSAQQTIGGRQSN